MQNCVSNRTFAGGTVEWPITNSGPERKSVIGRAPHRVLAYDRSMRPTRLYLVRHGATQLTAEDRFSGAEGVELSDEGRDQARRLGDRLRDEGIVAVYSSPLSRTVETSRL